MAATRLDFVLLGVASMVSFVLSVLLASEWEQGHELSLFVVFQALASLVVGGYHVLLFFRGKYHIGIVFLLFLLDSFSVPLLAIAFVDYVSSVETEGVGTIGVLLWLLLVSRGSLLLSGRLLVHHCEGIVDVRFLHRSYFHIITFTTAALVLVLFLVLQILPHRDNMFVIADSILLVAYVTVFTVAGTTAWRDPRPVPFVTMSSFLSGATLLVLFSWTRVGLLPALVLLGLLMYLIYVCVRVSVFGKRARAAHSEVAGLLHDML